ncbi:uncharacterized protein V6R79_015193 [Siganus canaliculatus]
MRASVSSRVFVGVFISTGTGDGTDERQFDQRLRRESGSEAKGATVMEGERRKE